MRWKRRGVMRTASGAVIAGATVQVFIAGGTTPANIYEVTSGGSQISQIMADSQGRYEYYVDASDYGAATRFKEVITKGTTSTTLDNIPIVRWDPTVPQGLDGELTINGSGNGITFPDGSRQTTNAAPGAGVTNTGDVSIAADSDANGSGEITFSTQGSVRARVPNSGGLEINDSGAWRDVATLDGAETLSNKMLDTPAISDFSNAAHNHSDAASGGALSAPTMTNAVMNDSVSGTAVLDEDDMASASAAHLATQQSIKAYVDTRPQLITEWSQPDDDHPYLNAENVVAQGKAAIKLPAASEAWVHGEFIANTTGQDINVDIDYMMSEADTDPVNWGLAYAVGTQRLCDMPWQASQFHMNGACVCPTEPNGCIYEMVEGDSGIGTINLLTGGTAGSDSDYASQPASNAVDDDEVTYWRSNTLMSAGGCWWNYDLGLGNEKKLAKFRIYWYNGASYIPTSFTISGSNDDSSYTVLYTGVPAGINQWEEISFSNNTAYRYYKIAAFSGGGYNLIINEVEAFDFLGNEGTAGASEPTWPAALDATVVDNEITWKCIATDDYATISLTSETAPAGAWTEATKTFTIPGAGISAGDPINILLIRRPGSPEHDGDLHLLRAMARPVAS
jgi:hypothetical protein